MFDNLAPLQEMPVTIVTERLVIEGTARTRRRRLSDLLNEVDQLSLVLADVRFLELGSRRVVGEGALVQVSLEAVLFAYSAVQGESAPEMRTAKKPIPATIHLPPFTLEGQIHLPLEPELRLAIEELRGRFVPVTRARYWAESVGEVPTETDLAVVNHVRGHIAIAAGVDWQPSEWAEAAAPEPGGW